MKILHITPAYLPAYRYGGPIESMHAINKWLVKKGVEVTVYTTNIDGPYNLDVPLRKVVFIDGVRVVYFKVSFLRTWFYSEDLRRALAKNMPNYDAVQITSVFLAASTLGAYYAKKYKKPYVISPRGSLMREPLLQKNAFIKKLYLFLFEKRNLRGAAAIHFTAPVEAEEYVRGGFPSKPSFVIPNGIDLEKFQSDVPPGMFRNKHHISPDKKIVLFLSRLNWKKGLDTLIPAFAEVVRHEPNAILILAGGDDEGYKKIIEQWICEHHLEKHVLFVGMVQAREKIALLQDSQVFVLPSYSENFGMAVAEAMYLQLPVVITPGVGIAPLISGAHAGLVSKKNTHEVARALLQILQDPTRAREMGARGKALVQQEFALPKIAEKFIVEYIKLVNP